MCTHTRTHAHIYTQHAHTHYYTHIITHTITHPHYTHIITHIDTHTTQPMHAAQWTTADVTMATQQLLGAITSQQLLHSTSEQREALVALLQVF